MTSEWEVRNIAEVCSLIVDCVNKTAPQVNHKTPYKMLRTTNIRNGRVNLNDCKFVERDTFEKWTRRASIKKGDIILTREAPLGEVGRLDVEETVFLGQRLMQYRANESILDSRFLLYSFLSPFLQEQFKLHEGSGSVVSHIRVPDCLKFKIKIPPLKEQKTIAHILGSLDDKIELNRQMNATLEAMAQALFKSWFVDFDPVLDNALAAGNPIPDELQSKAAARLALGDARKPLPADIQALFPSSFVLTEEMGWIPEGWEVGKTGSIMDVRDGTHDSPAKSETGYPLLTSRHITSGILDLSSAYLISEEDYIKVNQRSKVESGDILLTMIGTVGIPYLVIQDEINFAIKNVGLFKTSSKELYKFYLYYLLCNQEMQNYLAARMAGTTQKYLSLQTLRNIEFLKPSEDVLEKFNTHISYLSGKNYQNIKNIESLTNLRNTLLPKLLSGELCIPDAENLAAEVL